MKKYLCLNWILILATLGLGSCNDNSFKHTQSKECLFVEEPHFDWGIASKHETDSIEFKILLKNTSNKYVNIDKVDISCGCLSIKSFPQHIPPGKSGYIVGKIGIRQQINKINKTIFVNYNTDKVVILRVKGKVTE